ncbi:hypothetical protein ACFXB3_28530 [Streptomyces sp. NPDC059447]|uniref:hypothetical protein n=1 Tax=Streptomyces sp. NPDC059447 TaxID=3346834 RepID=UPI0036CAC4AD
MFAAVCVLLASVGHVLMSGTAVPWWAMSAGFVGTAIAAWSLASRERGPFTVIAATVAVQAALHCGFSLAQSVLHPSPTAGASHAHHGMHDMRDLHEMAGMHGMPGMAGMSPVDSSPIDASSIDASSIGMSPVGMIAAHLLAALLCGLWLAHGERGAFRILRAVAARLWTPLRLLFGLAPAPVRPRVRVRRPRRCRALPQLFLVHAITSRGPPTGTAVL